MNKEEILSLILDNWNKPLVFIDADHIIQYMNLPAKKHYSKWGDVIGKSIFDCHNENSRKIISDVFEQLQSGSEEVLYTDNKKHRVFMRSVRNKEGNLVGYYERYEPPHGK